MFQLPASLVSPRTMADDLRELTLSETLGWPSMKNAPPTRLLRYRSDDEVVHDALEIQWPDATWEIRTRCNRAGVPALYRQLPDYFPIDCMDCVANGPWPPWSLEAETFR